LSEVQKYIEEINVMQGPLHHGVDRLEAYRLIYMHAAHERMNLNVLLCCLEFCNYPLYDRFGDPNSLVLIAEALSTRDWFPDLRMYTKNQRMGEIIANFVVGQDESTVYFIFAPSRVLIHVRNGMQWIGFQRNEGLDAFLDRLPI
jgi:hypothetical protein